MFQVFEQSKVIQSEIHQTVTEMSKAHKVYNEEEHLAHDARSKAAEAEEK